MTNSKIFQLCFSLTLLFSTSLQAQVNLLDSIKVIESDTARLNYISDFITEHIYQDPAKSFEYVELYDSVAVVVDLPFFHAQSLTLNGMACYVNQQYEKSIQYYLQALELKDHVPTDIHIARLYNNIATSYQVRGDLENSIQYLKKSLDIFKSKKDSVWVANVSANLGLLLLNNEKYDDAKDKLTTALEFYKLKGLTVYEGYVQLSMANLYNHTGEYQESIQTYKKAIELVPESINPLVEMAATSGMGISYHKLKNYNRAKEYLLHALAIAQKLENIEQINECHKALSDLYEDTGSLANALHHQKLYTSSKDSLFTVEQDSKMVELLTKYEADKKEQELALLSSQNELGALRLRVSKNLTYILGLGLIILCGLLYWVYKLFRSNKQSAQEKDTLLREIHHRVKNNLQVISALLTLQTKYVSDKHAVEALQAGQDRVQSMALIHKDLYQHDNLKGVNTKDYLEKLVNNLIDSYKINSGELTLNLDIESIWLDVDTMIPMGLMINELVSNALKHAFIDKNDGVLSITLNEEQGQIYLIVSDNGSGISQKVMGNNDSFGQSLIKSFAKKLNADVTYNHESGLSISLIIKEYKKAA